MPARNVPLVFSSDRVTVFVYSSGPDAHDARNIAIIAANNVRKQRNPLKDNNGFVMRKSAVCMVTFFFKHPHLCLSIAETQS